MANNKVQLADGTTLIDLTNDTVTAQTMLAGTTAHAADGEQIAGVVNLANAGTAVPLSDSNTGSAGSSVAYAREDHVHPLPFASGTITKLVTTGTLDTITCIKRGNVVTVSGRIHSMTNNDGASRNYFQIPEGFRPPTTIRVYGFVRVESAPTASFPSTPTTVPAFATINSSGAVSLGLGSGMTVSQIGFVGTYTT